MVGGRFDDVCYRRAVEEAERRIFPLLIPHTLARKPPVTRVCCESQCKRAHKIIVCALPVGAVVLERGGDTIRIGGAWIASRGVVGVTQVRRVGRAPLDEIYGQIVLLIGCRAVARSDAINRIRWTAPSDVP